MASPVSRCSIGTVPIGSLFQAATSLAITMSGERLFSPRLPLPRFGFWLTIQLIMLSAELPNWRPIPPAVRRLLRSLVDLVHHKLRVTHTARTHKFGVPCNCLRCYALL